MVSAHRVPVLGWSCGGLHECITDKCQDSCIQEDRNQHYGINYFWWFTSLDLDLNHVSMYNLIREIISDEIVPEILCFPHP